MKRDFSRLVRRYGREVFLRENGVDTMGMAFIQPVGDKSERLIPTPLGRREQGRLLCLCENGLALETAGEEARLWCGGRAYRVVTAQPVYFGEESLFCWAVLLPDDEEETA